jgi:hypothetical protein
VLFGFATVLVLCDVISAAAEFMVIMVLVFKPCYSCDPFARLSGVHFLTSVTTHHVATLKVWRDPQTGCDILWPRRRFSGVQRARFSAEVYTRECD